MPEITDPSLIAILEQPQSTINKNDPLSEGAAKLREGEAKASSFLIRALGSNSGYEQTGVGPRSWAGQAIADSYPNALNVLPGFVGNSPARQVSDTTQDEFIAASLRQDSGAAIPEQELERQRRIYFPMPGDGPEVIAAKRLARIRAIQGLAEAAGAGLTPERKAAVAALTGAGSPGGAQGDAGGSGGVPPGPGDPWISNIDSVLTNQPLEDDRMAWLTPAKRAELTSLSQSARSPDEIVAWFAANGRALPREQAETAMKYYAQGGRQAPVVMPGLTPEQQVEVDARTRGDTAVDSFAMGAARGASFDFVDEIDAGVSAVADSLQGKGAVGDRYDFQLGVARGVQDKNEADSPIATGVGQVAGSLVVPVGMAARTPAQLARAGAISGGLTGVGSGETASERLGGGVGSAAVGAGLGAIGSRLFGGLANRAVTRRVAREADPDRIAGREVMGAATRLNDNVLKPAGAAAMQPLPADVGGSMTRRLTGAAAQGPVSALPIVAAARRVNDAGRNARDTVAARIGQVLEREEAGQAASRGADLFIDRTSKVARTMYHAAARDAQGIQVPLKGAIRVLDRHIAELEQVPGGREGVDALRTLRAELGGKFTVEGIRGMRTELRDRFMSEGLRRSDIERRVNEVVDASADDLAHGLKTVGRPDVATAYRAADRYWRARVETIDNVLAPIIGKRGEKSGEQVMTAIEAATKSNNARLRGFLQALPEDERAIVRATVIGNLGRSGDGVQDAAGNAFSLGQFLTHWNKMTPGAKATVFDGEARAALGDLARVAQGSKAAQRYQNHSNTASGMIGQAMIGGVGALAGLPGVAGAVIAQYATGRMLASPRTVRMLTRAVRTGYTPAVATQFERVAASQPIIAQDVLQLQARLAEAFGESPARLAAETESGRRGEGTSGNAPRQ